MSARAVNTPPKLNSFETYVSCKDHLVSGENFNLLLDDSLDLLMTNPKPENDQLGKYYESEEYISHTDGKKSIVDVVYQMVRNYTLKKKLKLIESFQTEEKNILDIGAGTGDFLKICADHNWKVTGVEPNAGAREIALGKSKEGLFLILWRALKKKRVFFLGLM